MSWFERHNNWFCSEAKQLLGDSTYKEQYQFINRTFISTGEIIVRQDQIERHPILIIYPDATPYVPPLIYPLNKCLEEAVVRGFSDISPCEIQQRLADSVRFYDRRHQNEDGSICLVEMGDMHGGQAEAYRISGIIGRLRKWFTGTIPDESGEVDLYYHFPKRADDMHYLIPELFFDEVIVKGQFYAGMPSLILANTFDLGRRRKIYVGVTIFGTSSAGVTILPKQYINDQLILYTAIPDVRKLILQENNKDKKDAISRKHLIEGWWWHISKEPEPFAEIAKLAEYVGNGDEVEGLSDMTRTLEQPLRDTADDIYIGLRYPTGSSRGLGWQMFRLKRGDRSPLVGFDEAELKERLKNYSLLAVNQERFTDDSFHRRNVGRADRALLRERAVSIIGCGALGSETSDALNKAGVGSITLVDKEQMKAHNAVRHCLGINRVSLHKAEAMAEYLILHNPFVAVNCLNADVLLDNIKEIIPDNAVGVSTIADDNVESYLNECAVSEDKTVFYCRALRGGKTARIFRVIPRSDACMYCLALYRSEGYEAFVDIMDDNEFPLIAHECQNAVRPGSAADMKIVSGLFSRIIIDHLQTGATKENHWIWSTEVLEGLEQQDSVGGSLHARVLPPHPDCSVCKKPEEKSVSISKEAYERIKNDAASSGDSRSVTWDIGMKILGKSTKKSL